MTVVKRDGRIVAFDKLKIEIAILKAMKNNTYENESLAKDIAVEIENHYTENSQLPIEMIEKNVFDLLCKHGDLLTARAYEGYRSVREYQRTNSHIDGQISEMISGNSEYWNTENSNKNAKLVTTQRDYVAGIVSTDMAKRFMYSPDIVQAHDDGIIKLHDLDYMINTETNCCLVNLEDMLQNGTVVSGIKIDKPHKLLTATTIATQIMMNVSSNQFGGQTVTLSHLAPFVRDSYNYYLEKYKKRGYKEEEAIKFAKEDLDREIKDSVQTFNYQLNSTSNCNGQTPFASVFMYINENPEYSKETAMLIEEFLKQRIKGMKNEKGVYITQAFPKLLYALDENNIHEDSEYYYLTKLAAECTAKRMVPDYISAKKMKELKGDVYPCMGKCKCSPCKTL